jgi:hypothetical protein
MVAVGSRVVTQRGLVPIEFVLLGDEVLTHHSRFRRVRGIRADQVEGRFVVLDNLKATDEVTAAQTWSTVPFTLIRSMGPYEAVSAISKEDWAEAEGRSISLAQRPRGVVIATASPQIVLGVSPVSIFGRILFAAALDVKVQRDAFEFHDLKSIVISLLVEEDNSFVCERLALRTSRG